MADGDHVPFEVTEKEGAAVHEGCPVGDLDAVAERERSELVDALRLTEILAVPVAETEELRVAERLRVEVGVCVVVLDWRGLCDPVDVAEVVVLLERDAEAVVLVDAEEEGLPEGDQLSEEDGELVEEPVERRVHVGVVVRMSELVDVRLD